MERSFGHIDKGHSFNRVHLGSVTITMMHFISPYRDPPGPLDMELYFTGPPDPPPQNMEPHCAGTLPLQTRLNLLNLDLTVQGPRGSDTWWPRMGTYSNLFTWGSPTSADIWWLKHICTASKEAVRILLECFPAFMSSEAFHQISFSYKICAIRNLHIIYPFWQQNIITSRQSALSIRRNCCAIKYKFIYLYLNERTPHLFRLLKKIHIYNDNNYPNPSPW